MSIQPSVFLTWVTLHFKWVPWRSNATAFVFKFNCINKPLKAEIYYSVCNYVSCKKLCHCIKSSGFVSSFQMYICAIHRCNVYGIGLIYSGIFGLSSSFGDWMLNLTELDYTERYLVVWCGKEESVRMTLHRLRIWFTSHLLEKQQLAAHHQNWLYNLG